MGGGRGHTQDSTCSICDGGGVGGGVTPTPLLQYLSNSCPLPPKHLLTPLPPDPLPSQPLFPLALHPLACLPAFSAVPSSSPPSPAPPAASAPPGTFPSSCVPPTPAAPAGPPAAPVGITQSSCCRCWALTGVIAHLYSGSWMTTCAVQHIMLLQPTCAVQWGTDDHLRSTQAVR